jgi:integrase
VWQSHISGPKTRRANAPVPVIEHLRKILDAHRALCGNPPSGWTFANEAGNPLDLNNLLGRAILPALKRCEVCKEPQSAHNQQTNHKYVRDSSMPAWHGWHAFRRGLATNLNRLGVQDKPIQAILRHSNLSTTMNVYVKNVSEDAVNAMNKLLTCADLALPGESAGDARAN